MNIPSRDTPTEDFKNLLRLLQRIHTYAPKTKSNYARAFADEIAAACSQGFITVLVVPGGSLYGHHWKMTTLGMAFLERWAAQLIAAEEERNFLERDEEDPEEMDDEPRVEFTNE